MIRITALLCAALFAAGCGGSSYSSSSSSTKTSAANSTTSSSGGGGGYGGSGKTTSSSSSKSAGAGSSAGSSQVGAYDNYFQPKTITGKPGSTVKIELTDNGQAAHTFTVDAQGINKALTPGATATVSVKIPSSGTVQFYCQYHKSLGMTGTIKAS